MSTMAVAERAQAGSARTAADPERWILPTVLLATTSIVIGAIWDISWHMSIGRDSLWSPPHLLEQFGAGLAGLTCGAYVLWLTFRAPSAARARTVHFWGFRGPLGAWLCIWGALAMIASVPFDDWWHNAYGLDVEILSPPHALLMLGVIGIQFGTMLFALAAQNRADQSTGRAFSWAFTYATGILLLMSTLAGYEYIGYANEWHRAGFYKITAIVFPFILVSVSRTARVSWAAAAAAAIYMAIMLTTMWVLQLVPAEPKLAPIYNRVARMVPLAFPLVLVAPAITIDLLGRWLRQRSVWLLAACVGASFVAVMLAVHWPFGAFMLSPSARNHFFGADLWPYMYRADEWRHAFWRMDLNADGTWSAVKFLTGIGLAMVFACVSARLGLWWGAWTRRVVR
ncbi:MAG: hypothetical protein ACRENP_13415 [Longimicrobiales bacterium]